MDRETIRQGLGEVFQTVFGREVELTDATTPAEVEGWDSLAHVTLMLAIEKRFEVKFTGNEIANAGGVGPLLDLLTEKTGS